MSSFSMGRAAVSVAIAALVLAACATPGPSAEAPESPKTPKTLPSSAVSAPSALETLARQSLATIDGELRVPGLKQAVQVLRDRQGIPHIYAQNDGDLFFAQGYVMAQDRLWQLEMWRRWREGRLAEVFGPKAFDYDRRTRLMMFRGPWDNAEWKSYHPDAERLFTAWADGLNAYVAANAERLPVEFRLTGIRPTPWTARTLTLRWAQLGLDSVRGHGLHEIQLALDVKRLGVKEANRRAAPDPWDELTVPDGLDLDDFSDALLAEARRGDGNPFEPGRLPAPELLAPYRAAGVSGAAAQMAALAPELQDMDGSNNWVVSGRHTASGVPIVSNDPHRTIEMPALRYFVHLNAPGWNVVGGGEPPFVGVDAGHNEHMGWGLTFAGTDMVDVVVEETNPADANQTRFRGAWEPMRVLREEIIVKGEARPRVVELKFTRHGPVFFEDSARRRAFAAMSVNQQPGTAPYKGSLQLAQALGCEDFFDRAMHWLVPTHNLICGDAKGNIAFQVTGLTPDRVGWNGRLPVPGDGRYEWRGFRSDLPREYNPARGYIATANDNTHPPGYAGPPVFYNTSTEVAVSRIVRIRQMLDAQVTKPGGAKLTVADMTRMQHDAYSLRAERDQPLFAGWTAQRAEVERARALVAGWNRVLDAGSLPAALYVRWWGSEAGRKALGAVPGAARQALVEQGLAQAIEKLTQDWGSDWAQWRYGRINQSVLPHMFEDAFSLKPIERPGGFNSVNATGANFRRVIDLANLDATVATNAPGQSAQPGSPYYGNLREHLANGVYFPLPFSRSAVEQQAAHRLTLLPP
jgi:penicillin amidase